VAPGDVIRVEKVGTGSDGLVEFPVLAVSGEEGKVGLQSDARVVGEIVEEGRGAKDSGIPLQAQEAVQRNCGVTGRRIQRCESPRSLLMAEFKAPELPKKEAKPKKVKAHEDEAHEHEAHEQEHPAAHAKAKKHSTKKKAAPKKAAKKSHSKKK